MKKDFLNSLIAAKNAKHPTVVITDLDSGAQTLWIDGKSSGEVNISPVLSEGSTVRCAVTRAKRSTNPASDISYNRSRRPSV